MSTVPEITIERGINLVYRRDRRAERFSPYSRSGRASLSERSRRNRNKEEKILSNGVYAWLTNVLSFIGLGSLFGTNVDTSDSEEGNDNQSDTVALDENEPVTCNVENGLQPQPVQPAIPTEPTMPICSLEPLAKARLVAHVQSFLAHGDEVRAAEEARALYPLPEDSCSEPTQPIIDTQTSQPRDAASGTPLTNSNPSIASSSSTQPPVAEPATASSATLFTGKKEFLEWVKSRADAGQTMDEHAYLTIEAFVEALSKEKTIEPIKLRFSRYNPSTGREIRPLPTRSSTSAQPGPSDPNPSTVTNDTSAESQSDATPSWVSGFSTSTPSSLPAITPSARPVQKQRMLKTNPFASWRWTGLGSVRPAPEQGIKRSAPADVEVPDVVKRRRLYEQERAATAAGCTPESNSKASAPRKTSPVPHAPSPLQNVVNASTPASPSEDASESVRPSANMTPLAAFVAGVLEKSAAEKAEAEKASAEKARPRFSHPDVVNPYEEEAIVKPKIKPMEKLNMTARRERTKELLREREATRLKGLGREDLCAREVIESTLPKGAKRSQPASGIGKGKAAATVSSAPSKRSVDVGEGSQSAPKKKRRTVTIEEASEEEEDNARNRLSPVKPTSIIEEVEPENIPAPARPAPTEAPSRDVSAPPEIPCATAPSPSVASYARMTPGDVRCTYSPSGNFWAKSSANAPGNMTRRATPSPMAPPLEVPQVTLLKAAEIMPARKVTSSEAPGSFAKAVPSRAPSGIGANAPTSRTSGPFLQIGSSFGHSSQPKTPSKLRISFVPDDERNSESPEVASPTPDPVSTSMAGMNTPSEDEQEKKSAKEIALSLPAGALQAFEFKAPADPPVFESLSAARLEAKGLPLTSLPEFDFSKARSVVKQVSLPTDCELTVNRFQIPAVSVGINVEKADEAQQASKPETAVTPTSKITPFDFAAAGMQPKVPATNDEWLCGTCALFNPASVKEKCTICDAPRPASPAPPAKVMEKASEVVVIDVDSANDVNGEASSLDSPVSASAAVVEPRTAAPSVATSHVPDATSAPDAVPALSSPTASVNSFDSAAAEAPLSEGEWKCSTCLFVNPATFVQKCAVCYTSRPRSKKARKSGHAASSEKAKGVDEENQTGSPSLGRIESNGTMRSARLRGA